MKGKAMRIRALLSAVICAGILSVPGAALSQAGGVLSVRGAVPQPLTLNAEQIAAMPRTTITAEAHHVKGSLGRGRRRAPTTVPRGVGTQLRGAALAVSWS